MTGLSVREQAALLVWTAVYPADWAAAHDVVGDLQVGGVILMTTGDWSQDELALRLGGLDDLSSLGFLVATDEEGGAVQRLSRFGRLPSQQELSDEHEPTQAAAIVASHATMVAASGIDVVLGPVVDVVPTVGEVPLQQRRFFSGNATDVASFAGAYVEAWQSAGLLPVLKHFPGHGSASGDTHVGAGLTSPISQLLENDIVPYDELASTGAAVMVGHLTVPGLTQNQPAPRSPEAIDYLRNTLGYADVLVVSDALGMDAVGLTIPGAAVRSISAGIDVVLFTDSGQADATITAIEQAVATGTLSIATVENSARRVLSALASTGRGVGVP